jgi:deoxyribodipyrimidine photo-lyase
MDSGDPVIAVHVTDPTDQGMGPYGFPEVGIHRRRFVASALIDLKQRLHALGVPLHLFVADDVSVFQRLDAFGPIRTIHVEKSDDDVLNARQKAVKDALGEDVLVVHDTRPMIHPDDLPFSLDDFPATYTPFRKDVLKHLIVKSPLRVPNPKKPGKSMMVPDDTEAIVKLARFGSDPWYAGGETAALERLESIMACDGMIRTYKETRNDMLDHDASSKMSAWLSIGAVSARTVYDRLVRHEQQCGNNASTEWFLFELLWRDFFHFTRRLQRASGSDPYSLFDPSVIELKDPSLVRAWITGMTGYPLVDANMRELETTGWMSNRGRQNVASFLTAYMGADWRVGAAWFRSMLLDHDVSSNLGNWLYVAGLGADPRPSRVFDVVGQGIRYDRKGHHVRTFVPELASLPDHLIYKPMFMTLKEQETYGFVPGKDYPDPVVSVPRWMHDKYRSRLHTGLAKEDM